MNTPKTAPKALVTGDFFADLEALLTHYKVALQSVDPAVQFHPESVAVVNESGETTMELDVNFRSDGTVAVTKV